MRSIWGQIIVVLLLLIAVGEVLRFPQAQLTEELKEAGFIQERLSSEKQLRLGQTGAAVALGGLRSLVASFMNLQAFGEYEKEEWVEVERLFDIIVTLQPYNTYYWETGAWHMGYNAYFDFENKLGMAPPRRRQKQKEYLLKSEEFLLRGTRENPENERLWLQLGRLFNDPHKPCDFKKAAAYLEKAAALAVDKPRIQREYFYTLGRTRGREKEALKLGAELIADPANNRFSSMRSQFYVLGLIQNPDLGSSDAFLNEVWMKDKKRAYQDLVNYWCRTESEHFPRATLDSVITRLHAELRLKDDLNPLKNAELRRIGGEF